MPHTTLRWSWLSSSVRALEFADPRQLRGNDNRGKCALSLSKGLSAARPPIHLDIAKAVEGERRLEHIITAAEDEAIRSFGGA